MKKQLSVLFVVLAVTAIFASTVFAAPVNGKSVSLLSVDYMQDGIVLTFATSGLKNADLKGAEFFAASNSQDVYCTFVNGSTNVRCSVAKSLAGMGGFKATLAGFIFWGDLPKARTFEVIPVEVEVPPAEGELLCEAYLVHVYFGFGYPMVKVEYMSYYIPASEPHENYRDILFGYEFEGPMNVSCELIAPQ